MVLSLVTLDGLFVLHGSGHNCDPIEAKAYLTKSVKSLTKLKASEPGRRIFTKLLTVISLGVISLMLVFT